MRAYTKLVVHRRVVVNLLSGRAISGVVVAKSGPLLAVKDARVYEPGSSSGPVPVDGEVVVDLAKVDFIQTL